MFSRYQIFKTPHGAAWTHLWWETQVHRVFQVIGHHTSSPGQPPICVQVVWYTMDWLPFLVHNHNYNFHNSSCQTTLSVFCHARQTGSTTRVIPIKEYCMLSSRCHLWSSHHRLSWRQVNKCQSWLHDASSLLFGKERKKAHAPVPMYHKEEIRGCLSFTEN